MNNVVGKMLIVMQLVFSILFMCFAGAVYTFQGQWRKEAESSEKALKVARDQTAAANAARDNEVKVLTARYDEAESARKVIQVELTELENQVKTLEEQRASASQERDKALADADAATTEAADRVAEARELNKEVQSLRNRITQLIKDIQDTEDQLLARSGEVAAAIEKEEQHLTEIGRLKDLLRYHDVDPEQKIAGTVPGTVEKVDGFVQRTLRNPARTMDLIEITIGSDDRISKNMVLTIYRGDVFVCQASVMRVFPDSAICVVKEKTRQGIVQRGDNVTTKL